MQKVSNRKCVRRLAWKSLKANRMRNVIAVLAIVLTTVLFTSLFTIAGTIVYSYQQQTFRQVGGDMHGSFKDLTEEQMLALRDDPLIVKPAARLMLGMPMDPPFNKAHVEVSYMDEACAKGFFCWPEQGSLPAEGSDQIACDTRILKLLGVEPAVGAKITLPYNIGPTNDPTQVTGEFTLSGWWEYDPAGMASQAIVPRSYVEQVLAGYDSKGEGDSTGLWTLEVYLKNAAHIEDDMRAILANSGYQTDDRSADNFIAIGVNWAYLGAQYSQSADMETILAIAALLLLIIFTGYLIIYNIFQISVTNDIRFYGLLKTIGTTPKQIRRMIRQQALSLSVIGIPLGLAAGYVTGNVLTPVIMENLSYHVTHSTANPLIFLGAAAFSLVTVVISCRKPGKMAGRVSPVEAVRYTENTGGKKAEKKGKNGGKVVSMALANLGRSKKKTVLVVLSLTLAVVLMQLTYTFANGFDMDKYLRSWVVSDFILGDASYFQVGNGFFSAEKALPEEAVSVVEAHGGITDSGRVYGTTSGMQEFIPESRFRQNYDRNSEETVEYLLRAAERLPDGRIADRVDLYGMEDFALDQLNVVEGDLSALYDPGQNAIAAVYFTDDYDNVEPQSHWAKVGDEITIRYVDAWAYFDADTGEAIDDPETYPGSYVSRAASYRDVTYTVAACVTMRNSMSYRYAGSDQFVLNAEVFKRDSGTSGILNFLFDVEDGAEDDMEAFLADYTENVDISLDYESKQSYVDEFESFRGMFLMLGGALSFIIGLVGILNFLNAVLTGIITRRREFAVLQSIGMTGRQLKAMLVCEGLLYALFAILLSLLLSLLMGPVLQSALGSMFWFFTYRFSILPVLCMAPVFLLLGVLLPLAMYGTISRQSIVERLREAAE